MALNPINILKRKIGESSHASASEEPSGLISGYRRAKNLPAAIASRDAMQKRREKQSAGDSADNRVQGHMVGMLAAVVIPGIQTKVIRKA